MNDKELIRVLTDEESFLEMDANIACGVTTGFATILSRPVSVLLLCTSLSSSAEQKILSHIDRTLQCGAPLVIGIMPEATGINRMPVRVIKAMARLSGVCPMVALVDNETVNDVETLLSCMDFCVYASGAHMAKSSVMQALDLPAAVEKVRTLLSFLPSNCAENAPLLRSENSLRAMAFTCAHDVVNAVSDPMTCFDVYADTDIRVSFARIFGRVIGVIGCNGTPETHTARFVQFCDCYSLPLLIAMDDGVELQDKMVLMLSRFTAPLLFCGVDGRYQALFDVDISAQSGEELRNNACKALEYLCVKRDVLPPHKHGNLPL